MTDKTPFDLDAALAALAMDERAAAPKVSDALQARVLGDAADVAAERAGALAPPVRGEPERSGGFRMFGLFDAWSGAAVAAVALCLAVGLGVGYEAGSDLMALTGLGDVEITVAAGGGDDFFLSEDVL